MQVSATLIAAQQAAREAQARFQATQAPAKASGSAFVAQPRLDRSRRFRSRLPLKQTAPAQDSAPRAYRRLPLRPASSSDAARPSDIKVCR